MYRQVSENKKLTLTINALCDPKGCKSGQSSRRAVSAKYLHNGRIYCPRFFLYCVSGGLKWRYNSKGMKFLVSLSIICILVLGVLLFATSPTSITSIMLVAPFVLIFSTIFSVVSLVLLRRNMGRLQRIRLSATFAGLPVALLVLQSIGQLTFRDIATIFALFALSYFYFKRAGVADN